MSQRINSISCSLIEFGFTLTFFFFLASKDPELLLSGLGTPMHIALDLAARLAQHQAGKASRYTRSHLPVSLAFSRRVASWSAALKAEHRIKRLSRRRKEALLEGVGWPLA